MPRPKDRPRPVSMTVIRRPGDGALLLGIGTDPAKGAQFCRPVGGGIEFGELAADAARRELVEELGLAPRSLRPLAVLENVYSYKGRPGHEIAFAFEGLWADPALDARPEFPVAKKSLPRLARWFPVEHLGPGRCPLVPEGLLAHLGGREDAPPLRVLAVDWSGAASGAEKGIWLAEAEAGRLLRLESGRTREALAQHLLEEARTGAALLVGIDFAFSFPAWYLEKRALPTAPDLWELADREGEDWLRRCTPPFWGRPGRKRPDLPAHLRAADGEVPAVKGITPKSPFQVGGAGAVGTGSVRGMPVLGRLREGGFSIWPFDPLRLPAVVEIYPRILTGAVVKTSADARRAWLDEHHGDLDPALARTAASSPDAFDAAASALAMDARRGELLSLPAARDDRERLEGRIFLPWREPDQPRE